MATRMVMVVLAAMAATGCGAERRAVEREAAVSVAPVVVPGNPTCAEAAAALGLAGTFFSFKIDPPASGTYANPADGQSFTLSTADGIAFSWSSTIGVDFVIAKGGNAANVYVYDPESKGDAGLVSPVNASGGPAALSHATFCYDYEVEVTKTAIPSFDRTFSWAIEKTSPVAALTLSTGQTYDVPYTVTVRTTGAVDSNWAVSGAIAIHNPAPFAAQVTGVADVMSGEPVAVACTVGGAAVAAPFEVPALGDASCTYAASLPDGADRTNVATVTTEGLVGGGTATAAVAFAEPTTLHDACVSVGDSLAGDLGTACQDASPAAFSYVVPVSYASCGAYEVLNTATFLALDTERTGAAVWRVAVDVPCATGCTLTQGYWKTHSAYGPARWPDDAWALVGGPDAPFYGSGLSYLQVLWTPPQGNAYLSLAHQFVAAQLNGLNGAALAAAQPAYGLAEAFFQGASGTTVPKTLRASVVAWTSQLEAYDSGAIGPGHCSE